MKQKSLNTLYSYWNELRAGRLAPRRLEVEPSRIAGILSETFMLERLDGSNYQYRLAGTRLCELFGSELRCTNFLAGWSETDQGELGRQLAVICEHGAVVVLEVEVITEARHRMEFQAILLPLLHTGNSVGRIIGAMSLTSPSPILGVERPLIRRLLKHDVIWPDGRPHVLIERSRKRAPFQAPPTPPAARPAAKSERPKLRVLEGGRPFWKTETP